MSYRQANIVRTHGASRPSQPDQSKKRKHKSDKMANEAPQAGPSETAGSNKHSKSQGVDTGKHSSKEKKKRSKDKSQKVGGTDADNAHEDSVRQESPPPYEPTTNAEDDMTQEQVEAMQASLQPEALAAERSAQMSLLSSLMDPSGDITVKPKIKAPTIAAAAAVESPEPASAQQEPAKKKARLALLERAKAPAAAASASSNSTWQPPARYVPPTAPQSNPQPDSSSSSEAEEEPQEAPPQQQSVVTESAGSGVKMNSLKEIFKPHEAEAGFSLGDMLGDAELEEDDYDPFAAFKPAEPQDTYHVHPSRLHGLSTMSGTTWGRPDPNLKAAEAPLFFPLCLDDENDPVLQTLNLTAEQKARLEDRSWTSGSGRRFNKLGSSEEITKQHEALRPALTEQVRKRHREAMRKTQRHRG